MAAQPPASVTAWTLARIRAEHPILHVWLGERLYYGALDASSDLYANVYIRLATAVVRQPFSWESIVDHLTTRVPLVA
jgi:hypothetical protein